MRFECRQAKGESCLGPSECIPAKVALDAYAIAKRRGLNDHDAEREANLAHALVGANLCARTTITPPPAHGNN